jgi:hypothetical protein
MRVLLVAPVEQGSGETITCLHLAEGLTEKGHKVLFLASDLASRFLCHKFADRIRRLGPDGPSNRHTWDATLDEFRPDAVVFADYPLLFFAFGATPLADEPGWCESLESLDTCLVTLDHFGFAQQELEMFLGAPHLSFHRQRFPAIPQRMHILLPCPMHEPQPVHGRRGRPFRYWEVPIKISTATRMEVRSEYLGDGDGLLIMHSVPNWAWQQASAMELPLYDYLGAILDYYLRDLPQPVTVVSVNNGALLQTPVDCSVRFVNLEPLPKSEFEKLLLASDLVLTENGVSIAMGKAVCGLQTCAALKNSLRLIEIVSRIDGPLKSLVLEMERRRMGAIFPFNVYPAAMVDELDRIGLYRGNSLTGAFRTLEIFGGAETKNQLHGLLTDERQREVLRSAQLEYVSRLCQTADGAEVLQRIVEEER